MAKGIQLQDGTPAAFSAAVYTQTTDVETEVNGLMTYDRKGPLPTSPCRGGNGRSPHPRHQQRHLPQPRQMIIRFSFPTNDYLFAMSDIDTWH